MTTAPQAAVSRLLNAWPAIATAQHCSLARVPFFVLDDHLPLRTGSVARHHLDALARWPEALRVDEHSVTLTLPAAERSAFFTQANAQLRELGLITAWRDETYPVMSLATAPGSRHRASRLLATFERAASRFWGTLTFGAHCNGFVADAQGRPAQLWIARRSLTKATDPGLLDNLIGGGVPHGQTPAEALLREAWEEAGLRPEQLRGLQPGRLARVARDIPEGFQLEELSVYDLALPMGLIPSNRDGEVHSFVLLPVSEALGLAAGTAMTVDASLATLDFALRHRLLPSAQLELLEAAAAELWV